ncbi:MAG: hypothetical protein AAGK04_05040, partial [Planctomycetota bacterium]
MSETPSNPNSTPSGSRHPHRPGARSPFDPAPQSAPANPADEFGALVRGERPSDLAERVARRLAEADGVPDTLRVLIVGGDRAERDRLIARLAGRCAVCRPAPNTDRARRALGEERFEIALLLGETEDHLQEARQFAQHATGIATVLIAATGAPAQRSILARRLPIADVIDPELGAKLMVDRLRQAVRAARRARASALPHDTDAYWNTRTELGRLAETTEPPTREPAIPDPDALEPWAVGALDDLEATTPTPGTIDADDPDHTEQVHAEQDQAEQDHTEDLGASALDQALMDWNDPPASSPSFLGAEPHEDDLDEALSDVLDVEIALRRVLEHVLDRIGPTNAAVFMPDSSGDYSLGAYVNYDRPKDSAEVMLDHLAGVIAPRFEETDGVVSIHNDDQLHQCIGAEAHWLAG